MSDSNELKKSIDCQSFFTTYKNAAAGTAAQVAYADWKQAEEADKRKSTGHNSK